MEIFLSLSILYLLTLVGGVLLERIKIPWVFSSLFLGLILSFFSLKLFPLKDPTFLFLANLGMYFMLFLIGFEINTKELVRLTKFIFLATLTIIGFDILIGSTLVRSFGYPLIISILSALSLATVGEAVLFPILDEFKLLRTKLGSAIIGVGIVDDIIEVFTIVAASVVLGRCGAYFPTLASLISLLIISLSLMSLRKMRKSKRRKLPEIEDVFLFSLFILFLYLSLGSLGNAEAIGALLAGICLRNFLPQRVLRKVEEIIKTLGYGMFAPIFFFWVGASTQLTANLSYLLMALVLFSISLSSKVLSSLFLGSRYFGLRSSLLMGVGLSVRFSTGLVIIQLLFTRGLLDSTLFTALILASTLSTITVPLCFIFLLKKWKMYIR